MVICTRCGMVGNDDDEHFASEHICTPAKKGKVKKPVTVEESLKEEVIESNP